MSEILLMVKRVSIFLLGTTILTRLFGESEYKKYMEYAVGLILIAMVSSPVLALFGNGTNVEDWLSRAVFDQKAEETVEEKVLSALRLVHMEEHRDKQIYRLSGGQKKMAAIATVLSMEPEVILFDEPSTALDPRNRRNLVGVLNDMSCTKIIASHDMDFIKSTCDRVFLLADRTIRKIGTAEEIVMDRQLLEESGL